MNEFLIGRQMSVEAAVKAADQIVVGRLVSAGTADVGAPGQSYYDNATLEVTQWLRPMEAPEHAPRRHQINYTVQTLPPNVAELPPALATSYIFFLAASPGAAARVIKLLSATEEHIAAVRGLLEPSPPSKR
ncbi:MAG: hypothetical protein U1G07_07075 [Verrucomicrobiota bacterium]